MRGFSLRSQANREIVSAQLMKEYIDALLKKQVKCVQVPQWQMRIDLHTRQLYTNICGKRFSNPDLTKRVISHQPPDDEAQRIYATLPYGYTHVLEKCVANMVPYCL